MMKRKRFGEGGGVREGRHSGISDDTRARAMAAMARLNDKDEDVKTAPVRTPKAESRPLPKPKPKPAPRRAPDASGAVAGIPTEKRRAPDASGAVAGIPTEKRRAPDASGAVAGIPAERKPVPKTEYAMDDMAYDAKEGMRQRAREQALKPVRPEEYMIGGGALKALQKGAQALSRRSVKPSAPEKREVPEFLKKKESPSRPDRSPRDADEARMADEGGPNFKRGGKVKESKAMVKKEMAFMKAKGAPKSMIKHEKAEMMGMKKPMKKAMGGAMKYAKGGGVEIKGKTRGRMC